MVLNFWLKGKEYCLTVRPKSGENFLVTQGDKSFEVSADFITEEEILLKINNRVYNVVVQSNSIAHTVIIGDRKYLVEKKPAFLGPGEEKVRPKKKEVRITMPGRVVAVHVENNEEVKQGQAILILEAMKMQNEIKAPQTGRVCNLRVKPGETVEAGTVLFTLE